jgi:hypothetical protein
MAAQRQVMIRLVIMTRMMSDGRRGAINLNCPIIPSRASGAIIKLGHSVLVLATGPPDRYYGIVVVTVERGEPRRVGFQV